MGVFNSCSCWSFYSGCNSATPAQRSLKVIGFVCFIDAFEQRSHRFLNMPLSLASSVSSTRCGWLRWKQGALLAPHQSGEESDWTEDGARDPINLFHVGNEPGCWAEMGRWQCTDWRWVINWWEWWSKGLRPWVEKGWSLVLGRNWEKSRTNLWRHLCLLLLVEA